MPLGRYVVISRKFVKSLQNVASVDTIHEHLDFAHADRLTCVQVGSPQRGISCVVQIADDVEVLPRRNGNGLGQLENRCLLRRTIHHRRGRRIEPEDAATAGALCYAGCLDLLPNFRSGTGLYLRPYVVTLVNSVVGRWALVDPLLLSLGI